jgi:hypothetical protein
VASTTANGGRGCFGCYSRGGRGGDSGAAFVVELDSSCARGGEQVDSGRTKKYSSCRARFMVDGGLQEWRNLMASLLASTSKGRAPVVTF